MKEHFFLEETCIVICQQNTPYQDNLTVREGGSVAIPFFSTEMVFDKVIP